MTVNITAIKTVRKLIASTDEITIVEAPRRGLQRTVTRLRFDNHDSNSHTPTFYVKEDDADLFSSQTPERWRLHVPRAIVASGEDEDCGQVVILESTQSLVVELAADPSDTSDDQVWPAVTANWIDQLVTDDFDAASQSEMIRQRFGGEIVNGFGGIVPQASPGPGTGVQ